MRITIATLLGAMLLLAGCSTGYQPKGFSGGYEESQVKSNVYDVGFLGNGYTRRKKAELMMMYRCAELARERGYRWFLVANQEDRSEKFRNYQYNEFTNSVDERSFVKPGVISRIVLLTDEEVSGHEKEPAVYNADETLAIYGPQIGEPGVFRGDLTKDAKGNPIIPKKPKQ